MAGGRAVAYSFFDARDPANDSSKLRGINPNLESWHMVASHTESFWTKCSIFEEIDQK